MITAFGPWMRRIKKNLQVSSCNGSSSQYFSSSHLWEMSFCYIFLFWKCQTVECVCMCVQVRRWSSSALGKVFSTMPSRATTPVSLPMDKLVIGHETLLPGQYDPNLLHNRARYEKLNTSSPFGQLVFHNARTTCRNWDAEHDTCVQSCQPDNWKNRANITALSVSCQHCRSLNKPVGTDKSVHCYTKVVAFISHYCLITCGPMKRVCH